MRIKTLGAALLTALICLMLTIPAGAESGECGPGVTWSLENGELTIAGSGRMNDYGRDETPWAFDTSAVRSVTVGQGVTYIGSYCFRGFGAESVSLPESLEAIGEGAFLECSRLSGIAIPGSVREIGSAAFAYCSSMTGVSLPESLEILGDMAFSRCGALMSIDAPGGAYTAVDGVLFTDGGSTLVCCPAGYSGVYTVPDGVEAIGKWAFWGCKGLSRVLLPSSLRAIGSSAFSECSALSAPAFPEGLESIERGAFSFCTSFDSVTLPASLTRLGDEAFQGCQGLGSAQFMGGAPQVSPDGGATVFSGCAEGFEIICAGDAEGWPQPVWNGWPVTVPEGAVRPEIDYSRLIAMTSVEECTQYLSDYLDGFGGQPVDDSELKSLAAFAETAVSLLTRRSAPSDGNRAQLDSQLLEGCVADAALAQAAIERVLDEKGVGLNRALSLNMQLLLKDIDPSSAAELEFLPGLTLPEGGSVSLMMGDTRHTVTVDSQALKAAQSGFGIRIEPRNTGEYMIVFTQDGAEIDRLEGGAVFTVPAQSNLATVIAATDSFTENWGGQYDVKNMALEFSTSYSGLYTVMEDYVLPEDVSGLDKRTREAAAFMASKDYLAVEDGLFKPDGELTRYEFTSALVHMFFALEYGAPCPFSDVSEQYRAVVASAARQSIVEGVSESEFGGESPISREEVIALCGRTLAEKKGYAYPENVEQELSAFEDSEQLSPWARECAALCAREGLLEGALRPSESITRAEAAVMLYGMFSMLYETAPVQYSMVVSGESQPETVSADGEAAADRGVYRFAAILAAMAVVLIGGGIGVKLINRDKSKKK